METKLTSVETPEPVEQSNIAVPGDHGVKITRAVTIRKPAAELYAFWRNPENLQRIIRHPVSIATRSETESDWTVSGPPGERHPHWTSAIINDHPGQLIAWETLPGADVANAGTIRFETAPGDEGTEVTLKSEYNPPAGPVGALFTKLFAEDPAKQVGDTLRRFKALMETGEMPTIEGQPVGRPQAGKKGRK
ncbi:MAG: SRPBCC family protein [Nibricoccus sp.]